jgi:EDD domain protein, DegV family
MIKIIVDSGCDLTDEMKREHNIISVPLNLNVDNKNYVDDENLDRENFLCDMEKSQNACKSSAPSPELYLNAYKCEEDIFAVTLSSKLSGSYNSALMAKQLHIDEIGEKFIHVFDSLSASVGETLIALKISELAKLNTAKEKIIEAVNEFIKGMNTFFILEKFDNFVKNGRINPYIAGLASFFSIKPICKGKNGEVALSDKARGYEKAAEKLINIIAKSVKEPEEKILGITHVKCIEKALAFKENIMKKVKFKDIIIMEATGLCTMYANRGGIIVAY